MNFKAILFSLAALIFMGCRQNPEKTKNNEVRIVGAMRDVMWKGELQGNISLDTIAKKESLYGLGPLENLAGEIVIVDGKCFISSVVSESEMKVEETYNARAPFFGYANITEWESKELPENLQTIQDLEEYLDEMTKDYPRPFMFRLSGVVGRARIHVVNLPEGSTVSSPQEAHRGQVDYTVEGEQSEIIGFFSTEHKAIFTHHDTFLHMHLITGDRKKMGHLDEASFRGGKMKLFLPKR